MLTSRAEAEGSSRFIRLGLDYHRQYLHGRALLEACGEVRDRRVLDLGCGEGWCCRELALRGADVVGVDISPAQVDLARSGPGTGGRTEYRVMDAVDVDRQPWEAFDLVTACMSLHWMHDPTAVLAAARRVLVAGGRIVCSMPHPLTHMRGGRQCQREPSDGSLRMTVGGYFAPAAYRVPWKLPRAGASWTTLRWSRSLSDYWQMFRDAGLMVLEMLEPRPTGEALRERPELCDTAEIPYYLILVAAPASYASRSARRTAGPLDLPVRDGPRMAAMLRCR